MKLKIEGLEYEIGKQKILKGIDLEIPKGKFVGIIGPNGSGKSTLLKNIYRVYKPNKGKIYIDGKEINEMKSKEIAKELAILAQESSTQFDFTVEDVVKMGRYPYKSMFEDYSKEDIKLVDGMIKRVGLEKYKDRNFNTLSGGEKQRAFIARALVQDTDFIILDEPTNHLDITYQIQLMDIIKDLNVTVFAALHDMNISAMYCDYIIVMKQGEILKSGTVDEIFTSETIKEVFGVDSYISENPVNGRKQIFYISGR
ncbi:ABC transporter ATP-binding protein [Clostridium mediterraneense]|uniref:ABC transporter ATP-binding protein n=1 Tax=Clostridium mediterraneense TaxID=1805472 RepID=UPI0008375024|nr:ABC transporter ATP-binding protein [Clostridium mediterraneense]